ncbi:MAG: Transcriptional initiation protein Tat [Firmicutes bacterium]|nr:Transcriptional initiation protein Tat [Bacillota bacterium]
MHLSRRDFLTVSGGVLVGLGALGLSRLPHKAIADAPAGTVPSAGAPQVNGKSLVVIYLGGGNDGLNTIAPYGMGRYYDLRRTLAIKESEALPLVGKLGLHPNLKGLKALYDAGKVAVIQGVGYPEPDRSHFRSFDIWATAQTKGTSPVGWLGRYLDLTGGAAGNPLRAVAVSPSVAKPLVGGKGAAVAMESIAEMQIKGDAGSVKAIRAMYGLGSGPLTVVRGRGDTALQAADAVQQLSGGYTPGVAYPKQNKLGTDLQLMVRLLAGGAGSQILYTTFGGFDEHAGEKGNHDRLMGDFDAAVSAYQADLEAHGLGSQVVTFVHSEFGRRAAENGSGGTDHGAAGPALLIGGPVRGGLVGEHPSLDALLEGDLKMGIDFRSVYATLLDRWLGGPVDEVLGAKYERLSLFHA